MFKKVGTVGINGLMAVLLIGMLALPISSMGLIGLTPQNNRSEVLSAQDSTVSENPRRAECVCPKPTITPEMEREIYERIREEEEQKLLDENQNNIETVENVENDLIDISNLE